MLRSSSSRASTSSAACRTAPPTPPCWSPPHTTLEIPVTCLEAGRWGARPTQDAGRRDRRPARAQPRHGAPGGAAQRPRLGERQLRARTQPTGWTRGLPGRPVAGELRRHGAASPDPGGQRSARRRLSAPPPPAGCGRGTRRVRTAAATERRLHHCTVAESGPSRSSGRRTCSALTGAGWCGRISRTRRNPRIRLPPHAPSGAFAVWPG